MEPIKYPCQNCGTTHEEWPALAFSSPDNFEQLSADDKEKMAYLSNDFCIIKHPDQTDRFIRCILTQKVNNSCQDLDYGLWVSLSEKSYLDYEQNFKKERDEKIYFGWLCSKINEYNFSESIPMNVVTQENGMRPQLFPHESFDHPFVKDFYNGISKVEAEARIKAMLQVVKNNDKKITEAENKKWWHFWK